jgi:D-glycero-D-manno-heptose 1,7-bisphosphate phosphatase
MVSNASVSNQQPLTSVYSHLQMPTMFDKFTVALDRDGVVCECAEAITGPDKFISIPDAFRAVAIIRSKGHRVVFLYDQPGISNKKVTIEQVEDCNKHMLNLLGQAGCTSIDGIWYSTSTKKDDPYAKPNIGLFKHAESHSPGVKLQGGVYVGDSIEDMLMAGKAGAIPVLVRTGKGTHTEEKLKKTIYRLLLSKVKIYDNLMQFAESL